MTYQIVTDATVDLNEERFPNAEVSVAPIGPVIGTHAGPGVIALFFWGQ